MRCDKCRSEAVFFQSYSGRHLCARHLAVDIEARAKRTIRSHRWMIPKDHIAVVLSGDKKSAALLFFLKKLLAGRRDIRLSALPAGVGETGGSDLSALRQIAEILAIPLNEIPAAGDHGTAPHDRPTKIALALTLDDIALDMLARFLFGNKETLVHPQRAEMDGVPIICPFVAIPAEELEIYWDSQDTGVNPVSCPPRQDPLKRELETLFRDYYCRHPATRFALMNLAEELSSGGRTRIAAAAPGLNGPGPKETSRGAPDDDT